MFRIETIDGLEVYTYTLAATDEMLEDCILEPPEGYLRDRLVEASTLDQAEVK